MEVVTYAVVAGAVSTIGLAAGSHAAKGCQGEKIDNKTRRVVQDYDKAEPIDKLQMLESDLARIKQQATQQETRIEEFQKTRPDEPLKVLEKVEKELADLKVKSTKNVESMETTVHKIEKLMTPKEQAGGQEVDGEPPVTRREALEGMEGIAAQMERLLRATSNTAQGPATGADTQDALRRAASAEDELVQVKREVQVVQERALTAETSAAQAHQEVLMLKARLSAQAPADDAGMLHLREENEALKADNTQLHTNQDTYQRNQQVLEEDNTQLLANQQQLEAQLQAALAREEALSRGGSASTEVSSLKEQLMAAMLQLESQQEAHHVANQKQNQETTAQHQHLSQQLQDAEHRNAKLAMEKDSIRQQLYDDHLAKSRQLTEEFEKQYVSLKAQVDKERREKEAASKLASSNQSMAGGLDAITAERDKLARQLADVQGDVNGKLTASHAMVQRAEARALQAEGDKAAIEARTREAVAASKQAAQDLSFCSLQRDGFKSQLQKAQEEIDRLNNATPPPSLPVTPSGQDPRVPSSVTSPGHTSRFGALKARIPAPAAAATGATRIGSTRPGASLSGTTYGTRPIAGTGTSASARPSLR